MMIYPNIKYFRCTFYLTLILLLFTAASCNEDTNKDFVFPELSAEDIAVPERNDRWMLAVELQLSRPAEQNIFVSYGTEDETALAGVDYVTKSGVLQMAPGESSATIEIEIIGNFIREPDKKFNLRLSNPINVSLRTPLIGITLLNDDEQDFDGYMIPSTGYTTPMQYEGFDLVWHDEFEGTTLSDDWTFEIGTGNNGWGNNELQFYRRENTRLQDGKLIIEARAESFGGRNYTSSRIVTMGKQSFQYGRIDIRAAMPRGQGIWPALWMLGENFPTIGWPFCGEIDIMEMIGGPGRENTVHGTIHWANQNGQAVNTGGSFTLQQGILADNFHVYTIIWDRNFIRWFIDDVQYYVVDIRPSGLNAFRAPFFFIMNVAVGGNWPGPPDNTLRLPQAMIVDYIRVFQPTQN
jgi:beta-glucanase (GH16 family)